MCTPWSVSLHTLDASSIIHAWDHYPLYQFPGLWNWLAREAQARRLCIAIVALDEVVHKYPDCAAWLKRQNIRRLPMINEVVQAAMNIKDEVGIQNDQYHPTGVGENDILIIAVAQYHSAALITNEARQFGKQKQAAKLRIPAVCDLPSVQVSHLNFVEYIKQSKQIF